LTAEPIHAGAGLVSIPCRGGEAVLSLFDHVQPLSLKDMKPALEGESVECLLGKLVVWKELSLRFEPTL